jgi:hypothetical protein
MGLNAVAGTPIETWGMEPARFDHMIPGCYDADARARDLLSNRILASVAFPTLPGFAGRKFQTFPDPELAVTWAIALSPRPNGSTRLVSRCRARLPRGPKGLFWFSILDPGQFLMERKMLLGIKERAEATAARSRGKAAPPDESSADPPRARSGAE